MTATNASRMLRACGLYSVKLLQCQALSDHDLVALLPLKENFACVDVIGDGNCGAYVLSIITLALTKQVKTADEIRRRIYELAKETTRHKMPRKFAKEFARTFENVFQRAFLNDHDLVLYLHSYRVNVHIITCTQQKTVMHTYATTDAIAHAFLIFARGCHWQVLARHGHFRNKPNGFAPLFTLPTGNALLQELKELGAIVHTGTPPEVTYTAMVQDQPLFRLDAKDRLWSCDYRRC